MKSIGAAVPLFLLLLIPYTVPAQAVDITIDGAKQFQTIEGFGTCLIGWDNRSRDLYRTEAFQKTFVETVGCSILRVNMWGPTFEKPTEDWAKIRYEDFDMTANEGRAQVFVDFGKAVRTLNPQFKVIGTVWSPPAWMKQNKAIVDKASGAIRSNGYGSNTNRVDPKYFRHFCKWMVEYVKRHDKAGVPFYAVSPGNEVQFTQTYESCVWDGKDFVTILTLLREMLTAEGYGHVKVFGPETMTSHLYEGGTGSYVKAIKADPKALAAIDVFATHGYEDGVKGESSANSSRQFWNLIKDTGKPFWITEGGTGGHDWPEPIRKGIGNALHNALVAGNCSAFVPWQIAERSKTEHAIMLDGGLTSKTYTAMHYFQFIRPGARRIGAEPGFGPVQIGAFLAADTGELTVVAINSTDQDQDVNLTFANLNNLTTLKAYRTSANENLKAIDPVTVAGKKAGLKMPAQSIVTLSGRGVK